MIVEVVGAPLRHLGRLVRPGARVDLVEHMARALISQGRARAVVVAEKPPAVAASHEASRNHQHQKRR